MSILKKMMKMKKLQDSYYIINITGKKENQQIKELKYEVLSNLQAINYNFTGSSYKVLRSDVEKWYGGDLTGLLRKDEWKSKVQVKLEDNVYISNAQKQY